MTARQRRLAVAITVGCAITWLHYRRSVQHPTVAIDWDALWFGARALLQGKEPYGAVAEVTSHYGNRFGLYYPLTAIVAMLPLAATSLNIGRAVFTGVSAGFLTYGLTGRGWWAASVLLTPSYLHAYNLSQWTPLLTAAALLPPLAALLAAKPTTGFGIAVMHPEQWRWPILGGAALLVASLALRPDWPARWLAAIHNAPQYTIPVLRPWGWLLLLAALRWRTPEGRLLLGLGLVPGNPSPYELLPLFLVARTGGEMGALWVANWVTVGICFNLQTTDVLDAFHQWWLPMLFGMYLPAMMVVLRPWRIWGQWSAGPSTT